MRRTPSPRLPTLATPRVVVLVAALGAVLAGALRAADAPGPAWVQRAQQEIAATEYRLTWQDQIERVDLVDLDEAWHAPNRAHGFRTYFVNTGIRVVPRRSDDVSWELGLELAAVGREGLERKPGAATLGVDGQRIDYRRGALDEWYVNDPDGLEQGFDLASPPVSGSNPLVLTIVVRGTLTPWVRPDGQIVDLVDPHGVPRLRYAGLVAWDSADRVLPTWIASFSAGDRRGIRLHVDDREASYPIRIDPLLTSPGWTAESGQEGARLGFSVGAAGDVNGDGYGDVIVGAPDFDCGEDGEGGAFVYLGSPSGLGTGAAWSVEGGQIGAALGTSVGSAGDVNADGFTDVAVGAPGWSGSAGRAQVFHGSPLGPSGAADWTVDGQQADGRFGASVASAGDVDGDGDSELIVGAPGESDGEPGEGRAHVYLGSAGGLDTAASWTTEGNQQDAHHGAAVAGAGDVDGDGFADVIVGQPDFDNGEDGEGRATVFLGALTGLSDTAAWSAESDQATAAFGTSVGTAGDVNGDGYSDVTVGSPQWDNGEQDEGRAWVYLGSDTGLALTASWVAESDQVEARFGFAVGTAGDVDSDGFADVIVGSPDYNNGERGEGRAFVYHGSAVGLESTPGWTAEGNQANAHLGQSVGTAGDVDGDGHSDVIVGAHEFDNGQIDEGRALVFHGTTAGLSLAAGWTGESNQNSAEFGISVSSAGDVDGDGFSDVLVGARLYDSLQANEGRAYAYLGSAAGLSFEPLVANGTQPGAEFGTSVSTIGDVNGDGYADVMVGSPRFDNGEFDEGAAFVYYGSATGLSMAPEATFESNQPNARLGTTVATAGDVNGDGYADVLVGAQGYENGQEDEGAAFLAYGGPGGVSASFSWSVESNISVAAFGNATTAGDVNGDGYADIIVGGSAIDGGSGRAYVHHGSPTGPTDAAVWMVDGALASRFGFAVGTAGDVNGDGFSDVIVGAPLFSNDDSFEGAAFVYHGSPTGLDTAAAWSTEGNQENARAGLSVATAGDVNGDGYSDAVVGLAGWSGSFDGEGRAEVFHGSPVGLSLTRAWSANGGQAGAVYGRAVSTAGDVNGDGYADVIIGASSFDNNETDEGSGFLYYGNAGPNLSPTPMQRRTDDTAPIATVGQTDLPDGFRLGLVGRTPFGRGRVKLEWEVKLLGEPFDGSNTGVSTDWLDTGLLGVALSEIADGLAAGVHHWRVRLRYDPASVPFQQRGRWITLPINGWQEADLRNDFNASGAGAVPDGDRIPGKALSLDKALDDVSLVWDESCLETDTTFAVYEGTLGSFTSHLPVTCATFGTNLSFTPEPGDRYFLVVPLNESFEGSYGVDGDGVERSQSPDPCRTSQLALTCN